MFHTFPLDRVYDIISEYTILLLLHGMLAAPLFIQSCILCLVLSDAASRNVEKFFILFRVISP